MRCIGQGLAGIKTFCGVMDLPPPVTQKNYDAIVKRINLATKEVSKQSMQIAASEEMSQTGSSEICVSGDGTWKTRGHTSKIGVCTIIGTETGKAIDVEVLSSFCKACEKSVPGEHNCCKNHSGSAGLMEVIGMRRIFERSEKNRDVRYVKYLGDGDTKTFPEIQKAKPYGEDINIEKLECIGHVQKRMGNRLRKLKLQMKGKKLSDGKPLSGKGRLTDKLIDKMTVYYGNAIRSNTHSLKSMREAVWASYCHMSSNDEEPLHMFCPLGIDSWCKFQKHCATKCDITFHHKDPIPSAVMKSVKKIYADLSSPALLKRCLSGKTQNPNESLNALIWKFCPKTSGSGKIVAEVAVNEAVTIFNEGCVGRLKTMEELELTPGCQARKYATLTDHKRIKQAEKRTALSTLLARRAKRRRMKSKTESLLQKEGTVYSAGSF